jgi:hypothetical protein
MPRESVKFTCLYVILGVQDCIDYTRKAHAFHMNACLPYLEVLGRPYRHDIQYIYMDIGQARCHTHLHTYVCTLQSRIRTLAYQ